jgi:hypothetical protein
MPKITVLCSECETQKKDLERGGARKVISCKPKAEDPRFCWLEFEFTFAPGGAAGGGGTPPAGGAGTPSAPGN